MLWSDFERSGSIWDPWQEIERMNRRFSDLTSTDEFPAVNIWSNGNGAIVTTELPGIEPGAVDISVAGKTLTLSGSRKADEAGEGSSFHRRERRQGPFSRSVELPFLIESNKVEAQFSRGALRVNLPRAEADKPKKIPVKML